MQDSCREFSDNVVKPFFPEKIIDGVDIGKVSYQFTWKILSTLKFKKEIGNLTTDEINTMRKLLGYIRLSYRKGENLLTSKKWEWLWFMHGLPAFSEWLESYPALGRAAAADKLEKSGKNGRDINEVNWG